MNPDDPPREKIDLHMKNSQKQPFFRGPEKGVKTAFFDPFWRP